MRKLINRLKNMVAKPVPFDASSLGDPMAMQTEWTPLQPGGANFRTHKLVLVHADRMKFQASLGAKLFYFVFLLVGLGVLIGVPWARISSEEPFLHANTILPVLFGLIFASVGGVLFYFGTLPIIFDRGKSYFWKGRKAPDEVFDTSTLKTFASLEDIYALQLVSEYCSGKNSSYYSYEMNLVLKDGQRINVVDHGNLQTIKEDAEKLAEFLSVPVWSAI